MAYVLLLHQLVNGLDVALSNLDLAQQGAACMQLGLQRLSFLRHLVVRRLGCRNGLLLIVQALNMVVYGCLEGLLQPATRECQD